MIGRDVPAFAVHGVADAAPGIGNIALVAGYEVYVQVEDGLAGGLPDVYAYVVAVGFMGFLNFPAGQVQGGQEFGLLGSGGVEPG